MKSLISLLFIIFTLSGPHNVAGAELSAFVTDGCTMFVDGTSESPHLWKSCCIEHDLRYWVAGSSDDMDTADQRLKTCVENLAGSKWAGLIYMGVRAGHYSPIKNKYHWGWAWSPTRENVPLSLEEKNYVLRKLEVMKVESIDMKAFIKDWLP